MSEMVHCIILVIPSVVLLQDFILSVSLRGSSMDGFKVPTMWGCFIFEVLGSLWTEGVSTLPKFGTALALADD